MWAECALRLDAGETGSRKPDVSTLHGAPRETWQGDQWDSGQQDKGGLEKTRNLANPMSEGNYSLQPPLEVAE